MKISLFLGAIPAIEMVLRWIHLVAGITWIGLLYWFNLVNVNFQKSLSAEVKPQVNPHVIPQTLFYFRWGAALTILSGLLYYIIILSPESYSIKNLLSWIVVWSVIYAVIYGILQPVSGALNNGWVIAGIVAVLSLVGSAILVFIFGAQDAQSNKTFAIGIGGGLGLIMMLNVWVVIWPAQKKLLGMVPLAEGEDKAKLARRAFLASRMNTWMSLPLLFFMAAASHYPIFSAL